MRWPAQFRMRMEMLFRRGKAVERLDDELRFHIEQQIAENVEAGMSAEEARYAALRAFGNPALLRDQVRATWSSARVESLLFDLHYCVRSLARSPCFTAIAILVMAMGIGANVALFTVVRSMLLKPLPYRDSARLVTLYERDEGNHPEYSPYLPLDAGSFWEWQRATTGMADMALVSPWQNYNVSAQNGRLPERIDAGWCSGNFFHVLGLQPALGRVFSADDDRPDAAAAVMVSYSFWKRRYAADRTIVGKTILLDGKRYTVIGVLPRSFTFESNLGGNTIQVWTPVRREAPQSLLKTYEDHEFLVVARLLDGTTLPQVLDRLAALQKQIEIAHPQPAVHGLVNGRTMLNDAVADYKTPLYALLAATGCLLLIACMNVASLLVARTAARSKELAIREALGGGRMRLLRQHIVESLLLSAAGGTLGIFLAWSALQWLVHVRQDMNRVEAIHIDCVVAAFTVGIVVFCAVFSGLISARSFGSRHVLATLQESSRAQSAGMGRARLRRTLLGLQVGLTVVLLVGAGLLVKSFQRMRAADVGVPVDNVLTMRLSLPEATYPKPEQWVAFFEQLIARVRAVPGVQAAGLVSTAPGEGWGGDNLMKVVEHPPLPRDQAPDFMVRGAEPGYFAAIGIPLLRGRLFTTDERLKRANVVVISKGAAERFFPGEDPIGKHLKDFGGGVYEIVGVVGDTRWTVSLPPVATLYWPIYGNDYSVATIVVRARHRARHNVESLAVPVEKVVGQLNPDLPVSDVMTLREAIGKSTIDSQFDSILVLGFAVIALALAAAGLYGVLAYLVTQRTSEIGIRIALGARRHQVLQRMLLDGMRPALAGVLLGLAGSAAAAREIQSMLYQTEPLDPVVFAVVTGTLLVVAAVACLAPAWRASRLDPVQALRAE
jgi:predicted permease